MRFRKTLEAIVFSWLFDIILFVDHVALDRGLVILHDQRGHPLP